jgi:hypothetical protein
MERIGLNLDPMDMKARKIINKLKKGLPAQLKIEHMTGEPTMFIGVAPSMAKKMKSSMRMGKGMRMRLSPEEMASMEGRTFGFTEGGRITLKSIGKSFKKLGKQAESGLKKFGKDAESGLKLAGRETERGLKIAGREIERGAKSKIGRKIIKGAIDFGADYVLPTVGAMGSAYFGADPELGSYAGEQLGDLAQRRARRAGYGMMKPAVMPKKGLGLFKTIKKLTGVGRSKIIKGVKGVARNVVNNASSIVGDAVAKASGNESLGKRVARVIKTTGDTAITTESGKKTLRAMARASKKEARNMGVEVVDDFIDANLSGAPKMMAQKALKGKYKDASDLIDDVKEGVLGSVLTNGTGMRRGRRMMGSGMAIPNQNVYLSSKRMAVYSGGAISGENPNFVPESGRIGSAYSPFVPAGTPMMPMKGRGNGLYAGSQGRGLY